MEEIDTDLFIRTVMHAEKMAVDMIHYSLNTTTKKKAVVRAMIRLKQIVYISVFYTSLIPRFRREYFNLFKIEIKMIKKIHAHCHLIYNKNREIVRFSIIMEEQTVVGL